MRIDKVIRGAKPFTDAEAPALDIGVSGERIGAILPAGELDALGAEVIDAHGLEAAPGFIDAHVHPIHNETPGSVGRAAPLGGVTTEGLHLYPEDGESYAAAMDRLASGVAEGVADAIAHLRITPDRVAEGLRAAVAAGVSTVKVFLAHGDPTIRSSLGDLARVMMEAASHRLPVIVHAELGETIDTVDSLRPPSSEPLSLTGLSESRPAHMEAAAVSVAASTAALTGARLYLAHVSNREALDRALEARKAGADVVVESCPHYLFLTAASAEHLGGLGRVLPPLREAGDQRFLRRAVAEGWIDVLGSDHCGHAPGVKRREDVAGSGSGLPGIELLGPLLIDAALRGEWTDRTAVVRVLCANAARVFGLARKGALDVGKDADVVLIDPAATTVVDASRHLAATTYSPYDGRRLQGAITTVLRRGETVVRDGRALSDRGGELLRTK